VFGALQRFLQDVFVLLLTLLQLCLQDVGVVVPDVSGRVAIVWRPGCRNRAQIVIGHRVLVSEEV
jgi:hypothetical protein